MSDTQKVLNKIAALRKQLEERPCLTTAEKPDPDSASRVQRLEQHVAAASQQTVLLDTALRQLSPAVSALEATILPKQLSARARRLIERGRGLVEQLRILAEDFVALESGHPLANRYQETAAMADTALRMVQAFPDAPSAQLRLCAGLEAILGVMADRVAGLTEIVTQRRRQADQIDRLAELLANLHAGKPANLQTAVDLAETLLGEAQEAAPLRFLQASPDQPAHFVACHSLTVGRVMARVVRNDPELRSKPLEPMLASLLHDVGMLAVPVPILSQAGPLDDDQRRVVESHTRLGAEILTRLLPTGGWLAEAAAAHHERLDGTGYPAGLKDAQIAPLPRLLAVCDVYAALCAARPFRAALDPRTALTDTLLLAEQGLLDRYHAERLLQLSFYPVGAVVELADGAVGLVVATHLGRRDLNTPARPVLALLTDAHGQALPLPQHLDLAQTDSRSIVRTLSEEQRREVLGPRYPELA
jgi:HD-GYP domain-containing protein (c-di-GMP phosphodiesterase class II)